MPTHIVLLGDSVFDNGAYTGGEPDVATHLRALLPHARVTLCAVDGSTTADLAKQLARVPADATDLVLSLGGNDALSCADLLDTPVVSTAEALRLFGDRIDAFEAAYAHALDELLALGRRVTVCTIYNGNLGPREAEGARIALMMFDDTIVRTALRRGVDVIELRHVCTAPEHFANPIEPSGAGGLVIARAVAAAVGAGPAPRWRIAVTAG